MTTSLTSSMATRTVTGLYDTYDDAAQSVRELSAAGIPDADISILSNSIGNRHEPTESSNVGPDAAAGAALGTVVGGGAGLLAGLGMLAIPGVGPVVAAGWLVSTVVGAVAGASAGGATGGVIGSLTSSGVDKEHAQVYAEGVRRGGTIVTARVDEHQVAATQQIMNRNHAIDPDSRGRAYRDAGWKTFDDSASPYTASELEQERIRNLTPVL